MLSQETQLQTAVSVFLAMTETAIQKHCRIITIISIMMLLLLTNNHFQHVLNVLKNVLNVYIMPHLQAILLALSVKKGII